MKKVVKFGGSSLASAEQFKKVGDIIRADEGRRYVVPSAPGKRNSACTVYTIIDLASYPNNAMNQRIANYMFSFDVLYSYSSAMAWMYFVVIAVILSAAYFLFVIFGRRSRR